MFNNIKVRFMSVIAPDMPPLPSPPDTQLYRGGSNSGSNLSMRQRKHLIQDKFTYARPPFLQLLTIDELRASADHNVRPIIVPRDINLLPWGTGYAECVNSGKSEWNEDQGAFCRQVLSDPSRRHPDLPYTYFGVFDGHAGYGAALAASHQFHHILHEKLVDCIETLLPRDEELIAERSTNGFPHPSHFERRVNKDELITGALESAFFHMDALIAQDRDRYRDAGGCTACVSLFINGKMFVANAGDSRAVLCLKKGAAALQDKQQEREIAGDAVITASNDEVGSNGAYPMPLSFDHTPETERQRLLTVACLKPYLLDDKYTAMEYARRPHVKDLGQRILCRQGIMRGWTYKTLTREDLCMPAVTGEGKRSRLLGTLGVTRGFGDHDLLAINTRTQIKPFLTPHPDVKIRDLSKIVSIPDENNEDGDYGILVMATDGLWDVSENEAVARTVFQTLAKYPTEKHRYTMVAQELVARARGKINDSGHWRLADSKAAATVDDISVIVIPVFQYYKEHVEWEQRCAREYRERLSKETLHATEAKEDELPTITGKTTLLNGSITEAQVEIENVDDDDDEDEEEEIVVELNRLQVQADVEVETDADAETENKKEDMKVVEEGSKSTHEVLGTQEPVSVSSSEATEALVDEKMETPETTPEKTNKTKHQQQQHQQQHRNRHHRKDKR